MAHEYTTWVYQQNISGAGRKFVLIALADIADERGYAYPGQKRLVRMTGQSERSVRGHLEWLEEHGYVRREQRRRDDGTRTSDAYFLPPKDSSGKFCRWPTTGKTRRQPETPNTPDQDDTNPTPATGSIRRLSTGNSLQSHRQNLPKSPAESAGHEPSGYPSGYPSASSSTKPQPTEPPEAAAAADQKQDPRPPSPPTTVAAGQPLPTDHPAFALLVTFSRLHKHRPNQAQFLAWSTTINADILEHGEPTVLEALTATNDNFPTLNYPFSFYRACLKQARAAPSFFDVPGSGQPPPPALDPNAIDQLIADAKEGNL